MKHFSLLSPMFWYLYLNMFLVITLSSLSYSPNGNVSALANHTDYFALLKFKASISKDPYGVLHFWNGSTHFCNWSGITCSPMHQRVTDLNLEGYQLHGTISPQLGNLSFLRSLNLKNNSLYGIIPHELGRLLQLQQLYLSINSLDGEFPTILTSCIELKDLRLYENNLVGKIPNEIGSFKKLQQLRIWRNNFVGQIPTSIGNLSSLTLFYAHENNLEGYIPQELGRLLHLQYLNLDYNLLTGEIPTNLTSCSKLEEIGLFNNNLSGKLPAEIGSLSQLQIFLIRSNMLTGHIPASIGNLSSLSFLSMGFNNLEGCIPPEIGHLRNLTFISLSYNKLNGTLPSTLFNISSLISIFLSANQFKGYLPSNMFQTLPNLKYFAIFTNKISGPIPISITNASAMKQLCLSDNLLVGQVPSLGKLHDIEVILLSKNRLGENSTKDLDFLEPLANCSKLYRLYINLNNFGGFLPNFIGNLSKQLRFLNLRNNHLSGKLPTELGNLNGLILLKVQNNRFDGIIPAGFGKFQNLQRLDLSGNKLSGDIPTFIGNLNQLFHLNLSQNMLEGNIPPSIGNCQKLQVLDLSLNNFRGPIPSKVFSIPSFLHLDLSQNFLSGALPDEVGKLKNIEYLDFSDNHLSGNIPATIGECMVLEYLYLQGNSFHGIIPSSLASLKGLRKLDLSRNHLSGPIPEGLQNISLLKYFNVSFNTLDGEVPTGGVFQNASTFAMSGNIKLCGGVSELHLPPCPVKDKNLGKHHNFKRLIAVIVCVVASLLILSFSLTIYWLRRRKKRSRADSPTIDQLAKVSYQNLYNGTDGFSPRNLIGGGSFGSVYKGTLESEDNFVAIKVLNLQKKGAHKSFIAECRALRNIRHRNLVRILTCCSSTDYKGQEFKALVFEFMTNGSLECWLHPSIEAVDHPRSLDLWRRFNIIVDVASALHYLHYECEHVAIHCDLKPSNILLDDYFVAHVGDFGLTRLLSSVGDFSKQISTTEIKGTIGYAPPEYGMGSKVSIEGDVYSFGILVLEMLTGRRPTNEMFKDDKNLHNYVKSSIPNHHLQIVDSSILPEELERTDDDDDDNLTLMNPTMKNCLLSLFRIALACSVESPNERMNMVEVIRELNQIKSSFPSGR